MTHPRSTTAVIAAAALVGAACSGGGGAVRSVPTAPARSTTTLVRVVRGQSLALHAMAYLASNPPSPVLGLFARASVAVVVGAPSDVVVQLRPTVAPVWAGMKARRLTVDAHDGPGRITVTTDGCPLTDTAPCDAHLVFAPTAFPIGPAPTGGVVTDRGFALHVVTSAVQPGSYEMTFPIRYPSNVGRTNVLDVTDTLHVRLDVDHQAPPSTRCTAADLHQPAATMPVPHALTATVVLVHGDDRLDPPPPGAKPRIPATVAWRHLLSSVGGSGGSRSLVLAQLTASTPARPLPNGTYVEEIHNVLAWVLYIHDQAANFIGHGGPRGPSQHPPVSSQPCEFLDGLYAINAATGRELFAQGGTPEHDPIRL